jgi:threonine synthase
MYKGVIERYRKFLPVSEKTPVITLLEGNTPLLETKNIKLENIKIYLKYEGVNPTGSFKDRGMTVAISKAKEEGAKAVICASTGNTSASAAAYAARANLRCIVIVPAGYIALGKLSQAVVHGAEVLQIEGNFDRALNLVKEISEKYPITLVNSLNPYRIEGQKTASFEICDTLGQAPDFQAMPVGNAGNITAYWKGYKEYKEKKIVKNLPVMLGFQASKAAPLVEGKPIKNPETIATAIRIGNPASWKGAINARDESGGLIEKVTDKEILYSYKLLAEEEGIFVEPASAASLAGVLKLYKMGYFKKFSKEKKEIKIVCILTGHGLKDPDRALSLVKKPKVLSPDLKKIVKYLKLEK